MEEDCVSIALKRQHSQVKRTATSKSTRQILREGPDYVLWNVASFDLSAVSATNTEAENHKWLVGHKYSMEDNKWAVPSWVPRSEGRAARGAYK